MLGDNGMDRRTQYLFVCLICWWLFCDIVPSQAQSEVPSRNFPAAKSDMADTATVSGSKGGTAIDKLQSSLQNSDQKVRVMLVAKEEAMISSRLIGTIKQIHVQESDSFKAGQTLVTFDCNELAAERNVAQSELKLHQTTNQANTALHAERVIGNLEKELSVVRVEEAAAKISAYGAKMNNCQIVAPFSGQVVEIKAKNHETLGVGSQIMLIQNSKSIEAHVHAPSKWTEWVKPGTVFTTFIEETGKSYPAEVTSLSPRVDAVSRTVKIYAKLKGNFQELLPGMSGYAEFAQQ